MSDRAPRPDDGDEVDRRFREIVAGLQAPAEDDTPAPGAAPGHVAPEDRPSASMTAPDPSPNPWPSHLGAGTPPGMATDHRSYEARRRTTTSSAAPRPAARRRPPLLGDPRRARGGPAADLPLRHHPGPGPGWTYVGGLATVAGFVLLVLRQPRYRRDDDWGARV